MHVCHVRKEMSWFVYFVLKVFCLNKLEWPVEYTVEKILPLITLWDMSDLTSSNPQADRHLTPKQ